MRDPCLQSLHRHIWLETIPAAVATKQRMSTLQPVTLSHSTCIVSFIAFCYQYFCKRNNQQVELNFQCDIWLLFLWSAQSPKPTVRQTSKLHKMFRGESLTYTCAIDGSSGWNFLWYRNGTEIKSTGNTYTINSIKDEDRGEYHCQARRGKYNFSSEASEVTYLEVLGTLNKLYHLWMYACIWACVDM